MALPSQGATREAGDDVVVQLRVRKANLSALEDGVQLGLDSLTGQPIELRLLKEPDGVYAIEVVTNPFPMLATPEPVSAEVVDPMRGLDPFDAEDRRGAS